MAENAIAKRDIQANGHGLVLRSLDDLWRFSRIAWESGTAKSFESIAAICVAVQTGSELGLSYAQSLQSLYVVNGKVNLYGDAALALVRQSGLLVPGSLNETITGEGGDMVAYCCCKRVGDGDKLYESTYTMRQANKAGLTEKAIWKKHPARMLKFKPRAYALRDAFGDVLKGLHLVEEMDDYDGGIVEYNQDETVPKVPKRDDREESTYQANCQSEALGLFKDILLGKHKDATQEQIGTVFADFLAFTFGGSKGDYTEEVILQFDSKRWESVSETLKDIGIPAAVLESHKFGEDK